MSNQSLKAAMIVCVVMVLSVCGYAGEGKGYKVVLASYPTFEEAKKNLDVLGSRLGDAEKALQKRYGYEIVARPAGRSYIIGIEPLSSIEEKESVLRHFKRLYHDAYGDKFYGPTEGTVVLESTANNSSDEAQEAITPASEPLPEADAAESAKEEIAIVEETDLAAREEEKAAITPLKEEDPYFGLYQGKKEWFWVIAAVTLLFIASVMWIRSLKWKSQTDEVPVTDEVSEAEGGIEIVEEEKALTECFEAAAEGIEEEDAETENGEEFLQPEETAVTEADMFYRLKKNIFFMTVIGQLKEAADNQDAQRCRDLMDEVQRYQKNFQTSPMIAQMDKLTSAKEFVELSRLISKESE